MTSTQVDRVRQALAVLTALTLFSGGAWAAQPPQWDPPLSGSIGTLPGGEPNQRPDQVLAGHVRLLGRTLDQALADVQHADLRAFAVSYRQMVDSYGALTDQVGEATEALGAAGTRVELARAALAALPQAPSLDPEQRRQLSDDIEQMRSRLIGRLAAVRAQIGAADPSRRDKQLRELQQLVSRVENLDALRNSLQQGARPLVSGLAPGQLLEQLQAMEQTIAEEERTLGVIARSAQLLVSNTAAQLRHTVALLEVQAQLPVEQLARLQESRTAVQQILDDLTAAHGAAAQRAGQLLTGTAAPPLTLDPAALLERVDQLVGGAEPQGR